MLLRFGLDATQRHGTIAIFRGFVAIGLTCLAACSTDADDDGSILAGGAARSSAGGNGISVVGERSASGGRGGASASGCDVPNADASCLGAEFEGEPLGLDIHVMFDQSGSMCSCIDPAGGVLCPDPSCRKTRLDAVREAMASFLTDPLSAGIGVGLSFFGKQPIGSADCNAATYEKAAIDIAELPDNAQRVIDALEAVRPTGETPTAAAIRGACRYATKWRTHALRQTVILLLTDGKPEAPVTCAGGSGACCPSLDDAASAAAECLAGSMRVPTYVLGVGPLLKNLEQIAVAGGTGHAYLVEGGDVSAKVLAALNQIRADAVIPCNLELPPVAPDQRPDYDRVNLEYADAGCQRSVFYHVDNEAACGTDIGWYYDDPSAPKWVRLCPRSCDLVRVPGGRLFYRVGCEQVAQPR